MNNGKCRVQNGQYKTPFRARRGIYRIEDCFGLSSFAMAQGFILPFALCLLTFALHPCCLCSPRGGKDRTESPGLRIVSLVPSITEIVYCLGAEENLVGNTNQCDYPEEAKRVYKVGDFMMPDIERIVALKPTLVFATLPIHRQIIEKLSELKIVVYVSAPEDIEGVFAEIESVGVLLGKRKQANELVTGMRRQLDSLPEFTDTPRVYVEISYAPLMSVGRGGFINDLIRRAGGKNVFESIPVPYLTVDPEMIVKANPDVILILHPAATTSEVKERVGWSKISAVRQSQVFTGLDEDLFFRPGPRIIEGIFLLTRLIHKRPKTEDRRPCSMIHFPSSVL